MVKEAMQTFKRNNIMLIVTLATFLSRQNNKVKVEVLDFDNMTVHVFLPESDMQKCIRLNLQSSPMLISDVLEALEKINADLKAVARTTQLFQSAMRKLTGPEIKAVLDIFRRESIQKV